MRYFTRLTLLLLALAAIAWVQPRFSSKLTIPAHEQFMMGGPQNGPFYADVKNTGTVPITILVLEKGQPEMKLAVLQPGSETTADASPKAALLFRNLSDEEAKIYVTGPGKAQDLSMSYQKEAEYSKYSQAR